MKRIANVLRLILLGFVVLLGGALLYLTIRHVQTTVQVEREWQTTPVTKMLDLGTTHSLLILPLVEAETSGPALQAEHGVSYLVKTDTTTILFDVGMNAAATDPSPLQANLQQLSLTLADVQILVISHNHPDHMGGVNWWRAHTFALGNQQIDLTGKTVYVPAALTYPQITPIIVDQPLPIAQGVATLGTIPFAEVWQVALFQARNAEQALAVNVASQGIVIITGCGHQTLPKLLARTQALFAEPIVGIVGGLHYENADAQAVQPYIQMLQGLQPQLVALSPHDSGEQARQAFRAAFPKAYQEIQVGRPITLGESTSVARIARRAEVEQ